MNASEFAAAYEQFKLEHPTAHDCMFESWLELRDELLRSSGPLIFMLEDARVLTGGDAL